MERKFQRNQVGAILSCAIVLTASFFLSEHLLAQPKSKTVQRLSKIEQLPEESKLSPYQKQLLKSLGIRIAVPGYVPHGFKLEKVLAEVDRDARSGGIGYTILYRKYDSNSNKDFCFAIEATNGGIGDLPEGVRSFPVNSPTFGKTTLEYGSYGEAGKSTFLSNWLGEENGPFYHFAGAGVVPETSNCSNISVQEAIRVTESLQ